MVTRSSRSDRPFQLALTDCGHGEETKGKGKKVEFLTDTAALAPFQVAANDIIATPLGVYTTVIGVRDGALWLKWPGGIESPASPAPAKARTKAELEDYGYTRRPQSAHIQRSIDERLAVRVNFVTYAQ